MIKKIGMVTTLIECHHIATSPQRSAVGFVWMKITNNIIITFRAFSECDCRVVLASIFISLWLLDFFIILIEIERINEK